MNILYIPQLSMYDKSTGKYIPEADGNLNMMRNFINEWNNYRKEDYFYILLPSSIFNFVDGIKANRTILRYSQYVTSARVNRYNFPMNEIMSEIKDIVIGNIDLVICDIPELSRNIIAMFEVYFGYSPKIMSNIRHIDSIHDPISRYNYYFRIFDAIECSNFVTILSKSMQNMLVEAASIYLHSKDWMHEVFVFEPSVSFIELLKTRRIFNFKEYGKKIITFPGRLSIGEENRTHWDKFICAIKEIEYRDDFVVYITDPNNSYKTSGNLKKIDKDRTQFLNLLEQTDIIVSLMAIQGFGGISIREALQFGCMPVIPYVDEYKTMNNKDYEGFIHGDITVEKLVEKLNWALDNCDARDIPGMAKFGDKFTIEYQMPKLLEKMEDILDA